MCATAGAFCYHEGANFGGFVLLVLTWFASHYELGFAVPMPVGTCVGAASVVVVLLLGPETKGKVPMPDLVAA
jgi:MFS transporter, SHS family, lactate transporter